MIFLRTKQHTRISAQSSQSGFTLIETLVAITILLLVTMGPISIAARGLQMSSYSRDELTAVFLAQEALEAVVNFRDVNALEVLQSHSVYDGNGTRNWIEEEGSGNPIRECFVDSVSAGGCELSDVINNTYENCSGSSGSCILRFDSTTNTYNYSGQGTAIGFRREIKLYSKETIDPPGPGPATDNDAILVEIVLSWSSRFGSKSVKLQTWLYDHYNRFENP